LLLGGESSDLALLALLAPLALLAAAPAPAPAVVAARRFLFGFFEGENSTRVFPSGESSSLLLVEPLGFDAGLAPRPWPPWPWPWPWPLLPPLQGEAQSSGWLWLCPLEPPP
jgi:hypothetical protein